MIKEAYTGNPDTVKNDGEVIATSQEGVAFGYFHEDLSDAYVFKYGGSFHRNIGVQIGKAFAQKYSSYLTDKEVSELCDYFYQSAIHSGRLWVNVKNSGTNIISFWDGIPSSERLQEICSNLGVDTSNTYVCVGEKFVLAKDWIGGDNGSQEHQGYQTPPGQPYYPCSNKLIEKIKDISVGARSKREQQDEYLGDMPMAKWHWLTTMDEGTRKITITERKLHKLIFEAVERILGEPY